MTSATLENRENSQNASELPVVAPAGFEPVFKVAATFRRRIRDL